MSRIQTFRSTPQEMNAVANLGEVLGQGGSPAIGWAKIPTYYYDVSQYRFPMTAAEFTSTFGGTIPVFNNEQPQAGNQSNAATGSGVNAPFLALGVGIVAIGEGEAFSVPGAMISRPAASQATPCFDGCIGAGGMGADPAARNATLWWGGPTWRFIEKMFQAYRLRVAINRRFLVVDESLFDVGMTPTPPEFVGAGDSLIPAMPSIRQTNDVMSEKSISGVFIPQNQAGTLCVGSPTANVTYGHPRIIGLANRIYCFNKALPILPGMRFDTNFVRVENDLAVGGFLSSMQRDAVLSTESATTPDALLTEDLSDGCAGYSSTFTIPGGTVSFGLVFKGFELQPDACVDYVARYMMPDSIEMRMLQGNAYLGSLISNAIKANLAGVGGVGAVPEELAKKLLKSAEA
jgi:hypothetical protein